jgi:hypothetical protein
LCAATTSSQPLHTSTAFLFQVSCFSLLASGQH